AVTRAMIDEHELSLEKEVILEEIKRDEDQPSRRASRALFEMAFGAHPYGRPVIGTRAHVASYDRKAVRSFYERWYVPANMVLSVAGAFDPRRAESAIARATKHLRAVRAPSRPKRARPPVRAGFRAQILADDVHEMQFEGAFAVPGVFHRDAPALDALAIALGQGDS